MDQPPSWLDLMCRLVFCIYDIFMTFIVLIYLFIYLLICGVFPMLLTCLFLYVVTYLLIYLLSLFTDLLSMLVVYWSDFVCGTGTTTRAF